MHNRVNNIRDSYMGKENFLLPKTENSINRIIKYVSNFFEMTSLVFSVIYVVYTVARIFLMKNMIILNIFFAGLTVVLTGIYVLESFSKMNINSRIKLILTISRRLVCCIITGVVFLSLFQETDLMPYRILFALFCGIGLFMTIIGDLFNATIPKWANEILSSFKEDIDISGLTARSFGQFKEAMAKNENLKEEGIKGALFASGTMALGSLRKLIHRKKK